MTEDNDAFYHGFALAVAAVARDHDRPQLAVSLMDGFGVTVEHLERAMVDDHDLTAIRSALGNRNPPQPFYEGTMNAGRKVAARYRGALSKLAKE